MCRKMKTAEPTTFALFSLLVLSMLVFLAACGSNSTTTGSGSTPTTSTSGSTPTSSSGNGGGRYGNGGGGTTPTATSASTGNSSDVVKTATATIKGKSETILTNAQGMTLYYLTSDTPPSNVCSGGCASAWPPLVVTSSTASSSATLPGKLTVVTDPNGNQVEYNGHPLYTYSGDTAVGQTNGEGFGNVWFVVPTSLK